MRKRSCPRSTSVSFTGTGIVATNCPSGPFPVKNAPSSLSPPIGTVPGTGSRMDAPLKKKSLAVCGSTFGWSSMLGLTWMGGRLDVQPRAHPVSATAHVRARARSARRRFSLTRMPGSRVRPHALEFGIRIAHLRQISRPGFGVQLVEERVVARIRLRLHDPARSVAKIAELDRRRGAGLLTGRLDVAITKLAPGE